MCKFRRIVVAICILCAGGVSADAFTDAFTASLRRAQLSALTARQIVADAGFENFKKNTFKEPHPGGAFIVNGDTPISDEEELREFYDREIVTEWKSSKFGQLEARSNQPYLIIMSVDGKPNTLDDVTRKNLSYCVSKKFNSAYPKVIAAMKTATQAWEDIADVKFNYLPKYDDTCSSNLAEVNFDVQPVSYGEYYARAFFPRTSRSMRNVLIDKIALELGAGKLTLEGILRHEMGHILSFRHEQTRPEAGKCASDGPFIAVTDYDKLSVMHYARCDDIGQRPYTLSEQDKIGAACLYGAGPVMSLDASRCRKI